MGWEQICINFVPKREIIILVKKQICPQSWWETLCLSSKVYDIVVNSFCSEEEDKQAIPEVLSPPDLDLTAQFVSHFRVLIICDLSFLFLFACLFWFILILKWHLYKCHSKPWKMGSSWWWIWWKMHTFLMTINSILPFRVGDLSLIIAELLSSEMSSLFSTLTGAPNCIMVKNYRQEWIPLGPKMIYIDDHTIYPC